MRRLAAVIGLVTGILCAPAYAAVTPNSPIYPQQVRGPVAQILPANTTSPVVLVTPGTNVGTNGTKVTGIVCSNTDSATGYALQLLKVRGGVTYVLNEVWVPANAGTSATVSTYFPPVSLMPPGYPIDTAANSMLIVEGSTEATPANSDSLQVASMATVNAGKAISCSATASDF
jgi:hypothetical protein